MYMDSFFLIRMMGSCAEMGNMATEQLSYLTVEIHEMSLIGLRLTLVYIEKMIRKTKTSK